MRKLCAALDFQENYEEKVAEAAFFLKRLLVETPKFGVVLGSGLGDLSKAITNAKIIPYGKIPNFPKTTVSGHDGKMYIGKLSGVPIIGLSGRIHYYEVADNPFNTGILKVVFPIHVLADLGVQNYFATTAVGGLNQDYHVGDLMVVRSHTPTMIPNPLLGRHMDFVRVDNRERVWRFQPMADAYNEGLRRLLRIAGSDPKHIHEGVYNAFTGPTYETQAECVAARRAGADVVGMSVVAETIAARNRGMNVAAMAIITNKVGPDGTNATNHEEVKDILESPAVKARTLRTVQRFFMLYRERHMKPLRPAI